MSQRLRLKIKSFDHTLVDKTLERLIKTIKNTGAVVRGPIPLPTHKRIFTVNRSTFVHKESRVQFQYCVHKRLIDIYNVNKETTEALMKFELPNGIEIDVKLL